MEKINIFARNKSCLKTSIESLEINLEKNIGKIPKVDKDNLEDVEEVLKLLGTKEISKSQNGLDLLCADCNIGNIFNKAKSKSPENKLKGKEFIIRYGLVNKKSRK
jgi:hypothetical protein